MTFSLRRYASIMSAMLVMLIAVIILEWLIINAVLGCLSWKHNLWRDDGYCFTVSQLIGVD